ILSEERSRRCKVYLINIWCQADILNKIWQTADAKITIAAARIALKFKSRSRDLARDSGQR
ncbi:MAG TPA: hypothetical protein DCX23_00340, partial [Lachnospiraceae bacterium]|nr:hypothetical protein [Lachnospiraceae bacterium]